MFDIVDSESIDCAREIRGIASSERPGRPPGVQRLEQLRLITQTHPGQDDRALAQPRHLDQARLVDLEDHVAGPDLLGRRDPDPAAS